MLDERTTLELSFPWLPESVAASTDLFDLPLHRPWHEFPAELVPADCATRETFSYWCQRPACRQAGGVMTGLFLTPASASPNDQNPGMMFLVAQCRRCESMYWSANNPQR